MNDFPWFKTSYQGFCGYVDLQVDKEHLRRVVMGNKDQQTKWNTLQGSKLLTPVMRHMSCLCIQPLSETRRGPQEIHVLRSFSSLCNSGSTLQCYFVHNRIKHVSLSQHTNQAISTPEKACHSPYMTTWCKGMIPPQSAKINQSYITKVHDRLADCTTTAAWWCRFVTLIGRVGVKSSIFTKVGFSFRTQVYKINTK